MNFTRRVSSKYRPVFPDIGDPALRAALHSGSGRADSEQLFCLGSVVAIALELCHDFALPRNVTFAEGHMLFGLY